MTTSAIESILFFSVIFVTMVTGFIMGIKFLLRKPGPDQIHMRRREWTPEENAFREVRVTLTSEERRNMGRILWIGYSLGVIVILAFMAFFAFDYWKFAVNGESIQATVMNINSYRSMKNDAFIVDTYTLRAMIDGKIVTDTYRNGNKKFYKIGDVVEVYVTPVGDHMDFAIKSDIENDPWFGGLSLFALLGISFISVMRWKKIQSGTMKFRELPRRFQTRRHVALAIKMQKVPQSFLASSSTLSQWIIGSSLFRWIIGGSLKQSEEIRDDFPKGT